MKSSIDEEKNELKFYTDDGYPVMTVTSDHRGTFDTPAVNVHAKINNQGAIEVTSDGPIKMSYPYKVEPRKKRRSKYTRRKGKRKVHRSCAHLKRAPIEEKIPC